MRMWKVLLALLVVGQLVAIGVVFADEADDAQIRAARAAINKGFAAHGLAAMTSHMTDRITFTGPAWRLVGKQQLEDAHTQYWKGRPDATWDYTPEKIISFGAWHWLSEQGTWLQKWTAADGPTELRGTYQGFWQREPNGTWMLDAHLFVTTSCAPVERAFCKRDTRR